MIKLEDLTEADKGRAVTYRVGSTVREHGVIKFWNNHYIFVRYGSSEAGIATYPGDLTFDHPAEEAGHDR